MNTDSKEWSNRVNEEGKTSGGPSDAQAADTQETSLQAGGASDPFFQDPPIVIGPGSRFVAGTFVISVTDRPTGPRPRYELIEADQVGTGTFTYTHNHPEFSVKEIRVFDTSVPSDPGTPVPLPTAWEIRIIYKK
jgi:hypothetical protein